jgi:protein-disulfide isomerase
MSAKKDREKRRDERLRAEAGAGDRERRQRMIKLASATAFVALAVLLVLIVVSQLNTDGGDTNLEHIAEVQAELRGIPQQGLVLGDPKAKVEVVEFGDLQCPVCKTFAEEILPPAIENQVRDGLAKVSFRNFPIISSQSWPAGAAALAAGAQGKGWQFVELFYRNQGIEGTGYADDEFLTAIARGAGVEDIARWNQERNSPRLTKEVERSGGEAERLGVTGTPSLVIKGPSTKGGELVSAPANSDALEELIEAAR